MNPRAANISSLTMNAASSQGANVGLNMTMDGALQIPSQNPMEAVMSNINKNITKVQSDIAMKTFDNAKLNNQAMNRYATYTDVQ